MATVKESLTVGAVVKECLITDWEADVLAHTSRNGRYMTDEAAVIALADRGLLRDHGAQRLAGGMHYLTLTVQGSEALREWRARQPVVKVKPRRQTEAGIRQGLVGVVPGKKESMIFDENGGWWGASAWMIVAGNFMVPSRIRVGELWVSEIWEIDVPASS